MRDCSHDEVMAELFREDPEHMLYLLNDILKDEAYDELEIMLRQVALAYGGVPVEVKKKLPFKKKKAETRLSTVLNTIGLRLEVRLVPFVAHA